MTSRCFGWAGFQMLRFPQHDSPLSFPRTRGKQKGASPAHRGIGGGMSDFAGLRSGGISDASHWHDRLITKTRLCNSRFIMSYALVSGSLPNLWVMLSSFASSMAWWKAAPIGECAPRSKGCIHQ